MQLQDQERNEQEDLPRERLFMASVESSRIPRNLLPVGNFFGRPSTHRQRAFDIIRYE